MTLEGTVRDGVIVLDTPVMVPNGTRVQISVLDEQPRKKTLSEILLSFAGKAEGLPADFAEQHDHYLHGTPKR